MGCKKIFSHTQGFSYNWHLLDITQKKYTVNTHVIEIASLRGLGQGSGLILSGRLGFRPELKTTVGEFRPIVTSICIQQMYIPSYSKDYCVQDTQYIQCLC